MTLLVTTGADPKKRGEGRSLPGDQMHGFWLINVFWQDLNLRQTCQREALLDAWKALKLVFGLASAPDPTREPHDAPPDNLDLHRR